MRAQLAEQEAAAEALLAEKEAAEEVAEQLWLQLQAVQEQAVEALQQLEDADAHKARLQQVGGAGQRVAGACMRSSCSTKRQAFCTGLLPTVALGLCRSMQVAM